MKTETKTETAKHTPTPWHVSKYKNGFKLEVCADNGIVCTVAGTSNSERETKANAEFIVRACNSRAALVEALKEITERYEYLDTRPVAGQHSEPNGTISRAKAALALALATKE